MIGIYKITNKINGHSYIGQSIDIAKRWKNHIISSSNKNDKGYDYPLYRAIRKYGIDNFSFEVLEECSQHLLDKQEKYWIKKLSPIYNQTLGGQSGGSTKLNRQLAQEIQQILLQDQKGLVSHSVLAKKYGVHKDTIRDINVGRSWFDEDLTYPLHYSKYDSSNPNKDKFYCVDCHKEISKNSIRCLSCEGKRRAKEHLLPIDRDQLKFLIRNKPFTEIGKSFGVTDNAIKKWCIKYNLPSKKKDIKVYSNDEWEKI